MKNVVIASCSDYLVLGITERIEGWKEQGWLDTSDTVIADLDLWHALLCEIDHYSDFGTKVYFWKIGDNDNTEAHMAARSAAIFLPNVKQYSGVVHTNQSGD